MVKRTIPKGVVKDIVIVGVGVLVIWMGLQVVFGTQNPFYVVASGSMEPVMYKHDVIIVQGHQPFEEIEIGDIIVFNRPSDHNRVIVHRVASILDENPKEIRTKGDANPASIPGTDFPITKEEYIGKVEHILPKVGYITQLLGPPINYIIIAVVIGIMIAKQMIKKKKNKGISDIESPDTINPDTIEELSDINKNGKDSEYSEHIEKTEGIKELDDVKSEDISRSSEIEETMEGIEDSIEDDKKED